MAFFDYLVIHSMYCTLYCVCYYISIPIKQIYKQKMQSEFMRKVKDAEKRWIGGFISGMVVMLLACVVFATAYMIYLQDFVIAK